MTSFAAQFLASGRRVITASLRPRIAAARSSAVRDMRPTRRSRGCWATSSSVGIYRSPFGVLQISASATARPGGGGSRGASMPSRYTLSACCAGDPWRMNEAEGENVREPDPPHGFTSVGMAGGSLADLNYGRSMHPGLARIKSQREHYPAHLCPLRTRPRSRACRGPHLHYLHCSGPRHSWSPNRTDLRSFCFVTGSSTAWHLKSRFDGREHPCCWWVL